MRCRFLRGVNSHLLFFVFLFFVSGLILLGRKDKSLPPSSLTKRHPHINQDIPQSSSLWDEHIHEKGDQKRIMQEHPPATVSRKHPGSLHEYADKLVAFEYAANSGKPKPHSLIFVGGLGDGLNTVEYMADLVTALEPTEWSLFNVVLSSSYGGWGMGRLDKDIDEIAQCVRYVRDYKAQQFGGNNMPGNGGKIVIMGHSTGCQDILHYLYQPNPRPKHLPLDRGHWTPIQRPPVDGVILQAPVSDREGILSVLEDGTYRDEPAAIQKIYNDAIAAAENATFEDNGTIDSLVPLWVTARIGYPSNAVITSRRFLSLTSPHSPQQPAEDDLFSSDLTDQRLQETFGVVGDRGLLKQRFLVLFSGRDQSVPPWVDKELLLQRWRGALDHGDKKLWDPNSLVVPNASHALSDPDQAEPRRIVTAKMMGLLSDLEKLA